MVNLIDRFNDFVEVFRNEIELRSDKLTDFSVGSILDCLTNGTAGVAFEDYLWAVEIFKKLHFTTAEGDDLDNLAYDRLRLTRKAKVRAVARLKLSRASIGAGNVPIPAFSRFSTDSDQQGNVYFFRTLQTYTMTGLTLEVDTEAVTGGPDSNVAIGAINNIETVLSDSSVEVTNEAPASGGTEAETDEAFRTRIIDYIRNLRRATKSALEFGAKQIAGVEFSYIDESNIADGYVDLYIGDVNNTANPTLIAAVVIEIEEWRAAGITVNVYAVQTTPVTIELTITYLTGVEESRVNDDIVATLVEYVNTLNIGDSLLLAQIFKQIMTVDGVENVVIVAPASDLAPAVGFKLILDPVDITIS